MPSVHVLPSRPVWTAVQGGCCAHFSPEADGVLLFLPLFIVTAALRGVLTVSPPQGSLSSGMASMSTRALQRITAADVGSIC